MERQRINSTDQLVETIVLKGNVIFSTLKIQWLIPGAWCSDNSYIPFEIWLIKKKRGQHIHTHTHIPLPAFRGPGSAAAT